MRIQPKVIFTAVVLLLGSQHAALAESERAGVMQLKESNPDRVYLQDMVIAHMQDSRMLIVDGKSMKLEGMISTAMYGNTVTSPDQTKLYAATTYYTKLNRGDRTDQIEIFDIKTLTRQAEIVVPSKHAQSIPYPGLMTVTPNGKYVLLQNATPAVSVTVVDVEEKKFLVEIPTPGCWAILPSMTDSRRFSTICGDGTLLTITFDEAGNSVSQIKSKAFFDPDKDPAFIATADDGKSYYFTTYFGRLIKVNVNDQSPVIEGEWDLINDGDKKQGWRPGGYQLSAIDQAKGRFYVGMHPHGFNGSHKNPAKEIWEYDLTTHNRLRRLPGNSAIAIGVSNAGNQPSLYVLSGEEARLYRYALQGKYRLLSKSGPALVETAASFRLK